jgi:hypothetical protein
MYKLIFIFITCLVAGCAENPQQDAFAQQETAAQEAATQEPAAQDPAAQLVMAQQAEAERKKQFCIDAANNAYYQSGGKSVSEAYDILNVVNLDGCPDDLRVGFENYRISMRLNRDIFLEYSNNRNNAQGDCAAGAIISLVESATGDSSGPSPCKENFLRHVRLSSDKQSSYDNLLYLNKELSQILLRYTP